MGAELEAFEEEFAGYCGAPHSVGVSSGTEAISLALRALEIGPGDEVIVPTNSFIATAEAVSWVGATAKLVDVDPSTHLLTAEHVAAAITPRTRAVIPVHLMGSTVDLDPILDLAHDAGLRVIEDTAQAHGADHRGRRVGSIGDIGCFSFYPTKNLGGWGDGGAIVTGDEALAQRVKLLRSHGESPRYHHRMVGTTARLDALQAALLRVKLRYLDDRNADRRRLGAMLRAGLADTSVELPAAAFEGADHVYHLFIVRSARRDALRAHLEAARRLDGRALPVPDPPHGGLRRAARGHAAGRRAARAGDLHAAAVPDHVRRRRRPRDRGRRVLRFPGVGTDEPSRDHAAAHRRRRLRLLGPEPRPQRDRAARVRVRRSVRA